MELIDRHFDQPLTATEQEELAQELLSAPDSAIAFARAGRLDCALESTFTESANEAELGKLIALIQAKPPARKFARRALVATAIAATLALCFGLYYLWPRDDHGEGLTAQNTDPSNHRIERPSIRLAQKPRLTAITPTTKKETREEATERISQRLRRYYLPQTVIQGLPLDEALKSLQQTFASVDQLGWISEEPIEFKLADGSEGGLPIVTLQRSNISALSALNLLALQSGHELVFNPPEIALRRKEPGPVDENLDPQFITGMRKITPAQFEAGPFRDPAHGAVIEAYSNPNSEKTQQHMMQVLAEKWNLELPDGSHVALVAMQDSPGGTNLIFRTAQREWDLLTSLIRERDGKSSNSSRISISTKLIDLPPELADGGDRIVDADEWQLLYRNWSQAKGTAMLSSPYIYTRPGESAQIELRAGTVEAIGEQVELPPGFPYGIDDVTGEEMAPRVQVDAESLTGLRLPMTASVSGEQITLTGTIDQAFNEDVLSPEMIRELGGSDPDSPIVHFVTDFEAPLLPGQVALFECASPGTEKKLIAAVRIDWVGDEISFTEKKVDLPENE